MDGVDERHRPARRGDCGASTPGAPPEWRVRFEESHATAIRFYQARTGRDVIGELRRGFAQAESDSARLVYGTMLGGSARSA